jgi:xylose isomerase
MALRFALVMMVRRKRDQLPPSRPRSLHPALPPAALQALAAAAAAAAAAAPPACAADGAQACAAADGALAAPAAWEGEFFPGIGKIPYEGPASKNPLAFKHYDASAVVAGKPMREWLKFSLAFWHTMRGSGADPFGAPTKLWPWEDAARFGTDEMAAARRRLGAFFELATKLGVEYWAFHDRDIAPELSTLAESTAALDEIVAEAAALQRSTGVKLLWATSQLFFHRRYAHGAATSPNATVFAHAAAQVSAASLSIEPPRMETQIQDKPN